MANGKKLWTNEEIALLEECYKKDLPREEIAKIIGRPKSSVQTKAAKMGFTEKYMNKCNSNYKAIYQDPEWLLAQVQLGKEPQDIANELGVSRRVIEKWLYEKNRFVFRNVYKLTDIQKQIVIWGTLGDGHIDKRDTQPLYIESHAIDEKDYIWWKYEHMKPMFNQEPVFYNGTNKYFNTNGKSYQCSDYYRMSSKIIDDLIPIRDMTKSEKLKTIDKLGLSLLLLDDGNRSGSNWNLCFASFTQEEKELFINLCKENFDLDGHILNKDDRYMSFDAPSSRRIDEFMLEIFPKDMDVIQKKIIKHRKDLQ